MVVLLAIAGGAACGKSDVSAERAKPLPPALAATEVAPVSVPAINQVPQRLSAKIALFRSLPERLPADVTDVLTAAPHGVSGLLAQTLPGAPWPAWIVPGRGQLCLVQQETSLSGIGQTCASTRQVLKEGTFITTLSANSTGRKPTARVVIGVVPDGTRAVRVHTPGTAPARATVDQNVFTLRDRLLGPAAAISLIR